jgi:hypothetical protein
MAERATDPEQRRREAVVRAFVRPDGSFTSLPSKHGKRLVLLDLAAAAFEIGVRYTEADVNDRLRRFHPDVAALRRYLVDGGFLDRAEGMYWRSGGTVDV